MTTESRSRIGGPLVLRTAAGASVVGGGVVVLGALVVGGPAAYGALIGTALAVVVLTLGTLVVDLVAGALPGASLLVALLTYTLQVVALAVALVALTGSGLLEAAADRRWLGVAILAVALTWTVVQIRLVTRARIPVYDLPSAATSEPADAGARR